MRLKFRNYQGHPANFDLVGSCSEVAGNYSEADVASFDFDLAGDYSEAEASGNYSEADDSGSSSADDAVSPILPGVSGSGSGFGSSCGYYSLFDLKRRLARLARLARAKA